MNRLFWRVFWISLAVRFLTAWVAPLTGDEAYYATWGMFPRLGYFDHPPMVGWWLSALYFFGHHKVWLRLPAILVPSVVGWLIPKFFDREKSDEAQLTGALFLLAPIPVFGAFITSDTPLILFTFLSVYLFFRAEKSRD
ncbi:MAG: ArnT family glycosyltransferase, partial [Bdellovibrionota bacterium]